MSIPSPVGTVSVNRLKTWITISTSELGHPSLFKPSKTCIGRPPPFVAAVWSLKKESRLVAVAPIEETLVVSMEDLVDSDAVTP